MQNIYACTVIREGVQFPVLITIKLRLDCSSYLVYIWLHAGGVKGNMWERQVTLVTNSEKKAFRAVICVS